MSDVTISTSEPVDGAAMSTLDRRAVGPPPTRSATGGRPCGQARVVTVHGQEIRVAVRPGSGEGTALLLCSGIGVGFEALQPFVDALDPATEVIRFDVPGAGGSPAGPLPYGFPIIAYLVTRLLSHLGYSRVDVLGLSWGGALAQQLAIQHPALVRKLVLVSTGTGALMVPAHPRVLRHVVNPPRPRDPADAAHVAATLYGAASRGGDHADHIKEILGELTRIGSRIGHLHQLLAVVGWTSLPWLPLIRQPTLILAGDNDPFVPLVNARIMKRLLPRAELHVYDGGHVALVTEADVLAPVVARFLTSTSRQRSAWA